MRWTSTIFWLCLPWLVSSNTNTAPGFKDEATEKLTIRTLQDGKLSAFFEFDLLAKGKAPRDPRTLGQDDESQHYEYFPLPFAQVLREYAISEMHLTLNSGRWRYDTWGYPTLPGVAAGAELWAWMGEGTEPRFSVDERWQGLNNALAGLFCASLGDLPRTRTTIPLKSFRPEGSLPSTTPHHLRHAILPSERVCTENLTPFLKLLPCKGYAGLGRLLNSHKLFEGDWHGIGIHATWDHEKGVNVKLTVGAVLDPWRLTGKHSWSFESLFGRVIEKQCAPMSKGQVWVEQTKGLVVTTPDPRAHTVQRVEGRMLDVWHVIPGLNVSLDWNEDSFKYPSSRTPSDPLTRLSFSRWQKGADQTRGGLSVAITNNLDIPQRALYVETMPWQIKLYMHTLTVTASPLTINSTSTKEYSSEDILPRKSITYIPCEDRARPTLLELPLYIPPQHTINLSIQFEKVFLKYTEHPPDAERGWDLPGAVLIPYALPTDPWYNSLLYMVDNPLMPDGPPGIKTVTTPGAGTTTEEARTATMRLYSTPLLANLATPDFSMPYNVIIMTGALIAFLFGSIFNLLTRKFVLVKVDKSD